jgi:peptidoglycan/LPS O-acetylase OafA/YrhL
MSGSYPKTLTAPPARQGRRLELDALRGLAATIVLFHHSHWLLSPFGNGPLWLMEHTPLRLIQTGRAPVLLFFVLSGNVLTLALLRKGTINPLDWALRRTVRLLLPVAIAVLLSAVLYVICRHGPLASSFDGFFWKLQWDQEVTMPMVLRQILLLGSDSGWTFDLDLPLWSLTHEWRISILLPLLLLLRRHPLVLVGATLALSVGLERLGYVEAPVILGPNIAHSLLASAYFLFPFAAGAALALLAPRLPGGRAGRVAAWLLVLAACSWGRYDVLVVAGACALILLASTEGSATSRFLHRRLPQWLGQVSYSLYLTHVPIMLAVIYLLNHDLPRWALMIIGTLLAYPVAKLFFVAVEGPSHRISQIGRPRPKPVVATVVDMA